ncbi:MAG: tetratricopeptide repeat protein [Planctomycetota bacterium]
MCSRASPAGAPMRQTPDADDSPEPSPSQDASGLVPDTALEGALDGALDDAFGGARTRRRANVDHPSVLDRVMDISGARPKVALRDDVEAADSPILRPVAHGDAPSAGKYVIQGEIGRGGVGAVHRGHDQELGRDVAMKFLHERYREHPEVLHRFVEEAQIGGQLQHPGIVPVYDLGMSDGRPFFTMKLVKGQTLSRLLAARASPADDQRRFLSIFEQVCLTLAYAHARGVVHRDLKPANIMIGSFGEVQVVDWGMGKVLPKGGVADELHARSEADLNSVIQTLRSSGAGSQSVMGSVFGTPAYMPPEQALGQVEAMDERSDVFGLGAILCELLTGKPPYVGEPHDVVIMAARADTAAAFALLDASGAPAALVDLCKRCLAGARQQRPRNSQEVANAITAHLSAVEERARRAEIQAAESRWRQRMTVLAAAAVLLVAGSVGFGWYRVEAAAQERQDELVARVSEARALAQSRLSEARAGGVLEPLWSAADGAADALAALAHESNVPPGHGESALALVADVRAESIAAAAERARLQRDATMLAALDELLIPPDHLDRRETTVDLYQQYDRRYLAAFADYLGGPSLTHASLEELLPPLRSGDIELRLATTLDHWSVIRDLIADENEPIDAAVTRRIRQVAAALDADSEPRNRLRTLLSADPLPLDLLRAFAGQADLGELTADGCRVLANALWRADDEDAAVATIRRAQELYPDDFHLFNRGAFFISLDSDEAAIAKLEQLRVARALSPTNTEIRHRQAIAMTHLGRWREAETIYRQLLADAPKREAHWLAHLGANAAGIGSYDQALRLIDEALALDPEEEYANLTRPQVLCFLGRHAEALPLLQALYAQGGHEERLYHSLGLALIGTGSRAEGEAMLRRAIEIDVFAGPALAALGITLVDTERYEEGEALLRRALEHEPENPMILGSLGRAHMQTGRLDEALRLLERAIELGPELPISWVNRIAVLSRLGRIAEAEAASDECLVRFPDNVEALCDHAALCMERERLADAERSALRAVALSPASERAHLALYKALYLLGRVDDAVRACEAGLAAVPGSEQLGQTYAAVLQSLGRMEDAVAFMDRWVPEHPDCAPIYNTYANCLENVGRANDAMEACRKGIAVEPFQPELHFNLGRMLAGRNRFFEAVPLLDTAAEQFARQDTEFAAKWRDNAAAMAELVRNEIGTGREVLSGTRDAASSRDWDLAVFVAVQEERCDELQSLVDRTLDAEPALACGLASGAPLLAVSALVTWSSSERCPDPAASRAVVLRLMQRIVERCEAAIRDGAPDAGAARWSLGNVRRAPSLEPVRGAPLEALPATEQRAWAELWKRVAAVLGG